MTMHPALQKVAELQQRMASGLPVALEVWSGGQAGQPRLLARFTYDDLSVVAAFEDADYKRSINSDGVYLLEAGRPVFPADGPLFMTAILHRYLNASAAYVREVKLEARGPRVPI